MTPRPSAPSTLPRAQSLLGLLLFATTALGCEFGIPGNGHRVTEERTTAAFSEVENDSSLDVSAVPGEVFSITISVDENLLPYVVTRVSGDTLVIDQSHELGHTIRGPHVVVTMPLLRRAALDGSGGLKVGPFVQQDDVALSLDGSGDLAFTGQAPRIRASLGGSGDVRVEGKTDALELRLDGSGRIDARSCPATSADVSLDGSGDISATVTGTSRVSLAGSGDVNLYGEGTLERSSVSGSGSIHRR